MNVYYSGLMTGFTTYQGSQPAPHPEYGDFWTSRKSAICNCFMIIYRKGSVTFPCTYHAEKA